MNKYLGILLLSLALGLSGCAQLYALRSDVGQQADDWVAQKEYGKAIDTLEQVAPSHPHYRALRAKLESIRRQADSYVHSVLKQSASLEDKAKWADADRLLATAQDRLPDDERLQKARRELTVRREAYVRELQWRELIDKGYWLKSIVPLRRQMADADPGSWSASRRLRAVEQEGRETGDELADAGRQALDKGKLDLARQALVLADELNPDPRVKAALAELERREAAQRKRKAAQRAREQAAEARRRREQLQSAVQEQIDSYHRCYRHAEWVCARGALTKLERLDPRNPALGKLQKQLDHRLHKKLAKGIERGRRLYSQGKIQAALDAWLPLRKLAPHNSELEEHITRARKVLAKLKELREKAQQEKATRAHPADSIPR
ncbi:MAG: hypothetical protein P8009_06490 [Gammaproteobacteria bacterium]